MIGQTTTMEENKMSTAKIPDMYVDVGNSLLDGIVIVKFPELTERLPQGFVVFPGENV
jgi:hypothetical protein